MKRCDANLFGSEKTADQNNWSESTPQMSFYLGENPDFPFYTKFEMYVTTVTNSITIQKLEKKLLPFPV